MILCRKGIDFSDGDPCQREAAWEIKPRSWGTWFTCTMHLTQALRTATTRKGLADNPKAVVTRL